MGSALGVVLAAIVVAAGCSAKTDPVALRSSTSVTARPDASSTSTAAPATTSTTFDTSGLTPEQTGVWKLTAPSATALVALGEQRGLPPVQVITGRPGPHVEVGPEHELAVAAADRHALDLELAAARRAATRLATPAAAAADGYVPSAPFAPGDGVHWIRWDLVTKPFDPSNPSMLLFSDTTAGARLIAFSYYNRSDGRPPAGFAGPNDHWHQHRGLCVTAGRTTSEGNAANVCGGIWLNGANLWMLHAWIVPAEPNAWGMFAPINQKWCLDIPGCGDNPLPAGVKP